MGRLNNANKGPPTEAELARQLKIKVGVVKRCVSSVVECSERRIEDGGWMGVWGVGCGMHARTPARSQARCRRSHHTAQDVLIVCCPVCPLPFFFCSIPHSIDRLVKEVAAYEQEAAAQEAKVAGMKAEGKDPYDIKKQEEVLQESYMMIPDSKARLAAAVEDLKAFVVGGRGVGVDRSIDCLADGWRGAVCVSLRCGRGASPACVCASIVRFPARGGTLVSPRTPSHGFNQQEENGEVKEVQAAESFAEASSLIAAQGS